MTYDELPRNFREDADGLVIIGPSGISDTREAVARHLYDLHQKYADVVNVSRTMLKRLSLEPVDATFPGSSLRDSFRRALDGLPETVV